MSRMIGRDEILELIPHQGAMCLWEEVVAWDQARIRLRTRSHADPDNPLCGDGMAGERMLRAVHLCEYGAQAMAVHGALLAGGVSVQAPVKKDDADKRGGVKDPGGTTWWIATKVA